MSTSLPPRPTAGDRIDSVRRLLTLESALDLQDLADTLLRLLSLNDLSQGDRERAEILLTTILSARLIIDNGTARYANRCST